MSTQATTIADLSNNNGGIEDFAQARAAGVGALWHKVSEGDWYPDPFYAPRSAAARAAGLDDGGYHMLRHDADIDSQVRYFCQRLDRAHKLRAMIDAEHHYRGGQVLPGTAPTVDDILRFGDGVHHQLGYPPVLYTYSSFLAHELGADRRLAEFPLDIADYGAMPRTPWPWAAWQFTDAAHIPGIAGACDAHRCPDLAPLLVPGEQATVQPQRSRSLDVRQFFRIPDGPADKVAPTTVWLSDGFQARPLTSTEAARWEYVAVAQGYPAGTVDKDNPVEIPWAEASRMRLVGIN